MIALRKILLDFAPDLRDVFTFTGLGCVAYGLAQIYAPSAWIAVGVVLFWLGTKR